MSSLLAGCHVCCSGPIISVCKRVLLFVLCTTLSRHHALDFASDMVLRTLVTPNGLHMLLCPGLAEETHLVRLTYGLHRPAELKFTELLEFVATWNSGLICSECQLV